MAREGDANGERLKPYYLALLKAEIAEQNMFSQTCLQAKKGASKENMNKTFKFTIPGRLPGYNELTSGHWAKRHKTKQEAMDTVGWCVRDAGLKPIDGKVTVEITCYEPNARRDCDNVTSGAAKVILDALQACRIIKGDGRKYVRCVKHPAEVDRHKPRVEVQIIKG